MRTFHALVLAASLAACAGSHVARADVLIRVDLSRQEMTVDVAGTSRHVWPVSSAAPGYVTPTGSYRPQRMHTIWYSKQYDDAPMPHSIFYSGGYAIHGTQSVRMLGRPASHGCVRLSPQNARTLFDLVKAQGMSKTRIVIHGTPPKPATPTQVARIRERPAQVVRVRAADPGIFSQPFWAPTLQPTLRARKTIPTYGVVSRGSITYYRAPTYRVR